MKIIYVRPQSTSGRLRIGASDGENKYDYSLSESEYSALGSLLSGDLIDEDTHNKIRSFDLLYRARKKALGILSYADNSEQALIRKLRMAGFSSEISRLVGAEMVSRGYVNDSRQLKRFISAEVRINKTGPAKLIPKLMAKGYTRSDITTVLDELVCSGEVNFEEAKKALIEKLDGESDEIIKKTLYKNGY